MSNLDKLLSVPDFEKKARQRLPRCVFGYIRGGTEGECSLRENRAIFSRLAFVPLGLAGVSERTQTATLLGRSYASPVGIAPTGLAGLVWHEGDLELCKAAKQANVPFIISGSSNVPLERLQQANPDNWYQAYFPGDRGRIGRILSRLEKAGIKVLVVTIDTCMAANRENNIRMDFTIPFRMTPRLLLDGVLHPRWCVDVFLKTIVRSGVPRFSNLYEEKGPPITKEPTHGFRTGRDKLDWKDLAWLRGRWKGQLLIKGVLHPRDAAQAVSIGVDGLIVSNHGGRQLDGAVSPLQALPLVVREVRQSIPVMIDGGFRRGTDVLKALALGASYVFVGRPTLFGCAIAGAQGVGKVLDIFRSEIDRDLALLGCSKLDQITPDLLISCGAPDIGIIREHANV